MSSQLYRILFVGDDNMQAQALHSLLGTGPEVFELIHARSLEMGVSVLQNLSTDALLLGECAGSDFVSQIARIRAHSATDPIILLLPTETEAVARRLLAAGASDYLSKEELSSPMLKRILKHAIERKRGEDALRQSEQRFQELFENAKDIIFTLDLEGNFTSLNKSAEDVTGWSREEARDINIKKIVAPEHLNLCKQIMTHIVNEECVQPFEISLLRKDGSRVLLDACARLIHTEGMEKCIQGIARDVTERRNLENAVRQSQKLDAVGRLSGGLAHDFNNLLCVISGHAELLSEQLPSGHPGTRNVEQIKKAVENASTLTRQLLAFSRKQLFHPRALNLNTIVAETERLLGRLVGENIDFHTAPHPSLGSVHADPVQIEQVIINLVLNACDAMPQHGKLTVETYNVELNEACRSKRAIVPPGKYVVLAVTDNGSGMDEKTQSRIFEPFYTTKEMGKGTGLGLATVYGIVKQSGGSIAVYSEPGQGTTFKIYFPCVDAPAPEETSTRPAPDNRSGSETVLLVENSAPLRALAKEFLRGAGYTVLEAENGKEAIRIVSAFGGPIHLLLTDVIMPEMGGKQLAEHFATIRPATRVLYISGYSGEGLVHSGWLGPERTFLEKPFTREILLRKIRNVLDESPPLAERPRVDGAFPAPS